MVTLGAGATAVPTVASASSGARLIYTHRVAGGPLLPASLGSSGLHQVTINTHPVAKSRGAARGTVPSITAQPASVTVKAGAEVSFKAAAKGSPSPAIQWKDSSNGKKWSVIRGATKTTYVFVASAAKNGYSFEASFANAAGSTVTKVVKLKVLSAPKITQQPSGDVVQAGSQATFSAAASGQPRPSVQWEESANGSSWTEIGGATSSEYSFVAQSNKNGYEFEAVFKNAEGKATTQRATLTVTLASVAPTVISQPSPVVITAGSSVTFTASASGSPTPTVQWDVSTGGATWAPIAGATATTYSFIAPIGDNGYEFEAVFTNTAGSVASSPAMLTVNPAPVAPAISTQPSSESISNGSTASFGAAASGTPTPTVQWQQSTDGINWSSLGGQTSSSLIFTAQYSESGYQYRAVFSNSQGSVSSNAATLTVTGTGGIPVVVTQPNNYAVFVGSSASFTATASGSPTPTVQWSVSTNGGASWTTVSEATSSTYSFTTTANEEENEYEATFTNSAGSVTSRPATLSVVVEPNTATYNWSGYSDSGSTFTGVSADWTVPSVTCSGSSTLYSSQWIGIDGDVSSTVEQDGTEADCIGGAPNYDAWYEMYGDNAVNSGYEVELPPFSYPVSPGDAIAASVTVANNNWTLSLTDTSNSHNGWTFSTQISFTAQQSSAEWIVERPEINSALADLAEFSPVTFTDAQVSGTSGAGGINMYSPDDTEMVGTSDDELAIATGLNTAATSFGDFWQASS